MKEQETKSQPNNMDLKLALTRKFYENSLHFKRRIKEQTIDEENKKMFSRLMKIVSFDSKSAIPNTHSIIFTTHQIKSNILYLVVPRSLANSKRK